ncbi:MAG TPA: flagellar hook capping FlgD N-terminal domain-containing protein [Geminicoccaceae bacterium]|nr:flagellar hook capping FlgD N-terminal domain-containing protein [Geminicoccus sp.]HMU49635.1 flagellar hook capping FlgD N-terminal domain-containing protein [Geminicoccaceae bacterium]
MIGATSSATTATTASQTAGSKLADTFDNFLQLLTKQLEKQDPLSPMDATQFTTQLVQFSTVEQAINTNSKLDKLIEAVSSSAQTSALQYIDSTVELDTRVGYLAGTGGTTFGYSLPSAATQVAIRVLDADGNTVRETAGGRAAGANSFVWDGNGSSGARKPAGIYRIEVTALDAAGEPLAVEASASGLVGGVTTADGRLMLSVGGTEVPVEAVTAVRRAGAAT